MKKVLLAPRFLLALAPVGLAVAYYDAYVLYNAQQLWCPPPINGCNEVAFALRMFAFNSKRTLVASSRTPVSAGTARAA
jgi:hypothetical protein